LPHKPAPLTAGDLVSLVAPAGPCDSGRLDAGIKLLESWGLRVNEPPSTAGDSLHYLAADDRTRARGIVEAFGSPDVRAILSVRGGYGSARLHELVDVSAAASDPKIFVGFSDVTVLLSRLVQSADMVCYHGPMVAADLPRLDAEAGDRFRRFLFGQPDWFDGEARECWRRGDGAEGPLVGGCLSMLVTTLGTPYDVDTDHCVLFLEDVAEKPYRIDRMLNHMKHAGKFDHVRGLVLGPMIDCDDGGGSELLRAVFLDVLADFDFPIVFGLEAGHGSANVVLPLGCRARLDVAGAGLELLESPFA